MTRLSRLADVGLVGLILLAVLQTGQTILTPEAARLSGQADAGMLALARTENTAAALADVFFRDVSPSARKAAPLVDKGNIKLFGTRPRENGMGSAILSDNGQPQAVFKTGQSLSKGAVLTAVYADRVEISRNGEARSVYLRDPAAQTKRQLIKSAEPNGIHAAINRSTTEAAPQPKFRSLFPSQRTRTRPKAASRQQPAGAAILSALNLTAADNGLAIGSGASPEILDALRLAQGDVIIAVNGQSVRDRSAMGNMYRQLQRGGGMAVTLLRDGQQVTVSINANALNLAQTGQ